MVCHISCSAITYLMLVTFALNHSLQPLYFHQYNDININAILRNTTTPYDLSVWYLQKRDIRNSVRTLWEHNFISKILKIPDISGIDFVNFAWWYLMHPFNHHAFLLQNIFQYNLNLVKPSED